jgi:hypothetical protein
VDRLLRHRILSLCWPASSCRCGKKAIAAAGQVCSTQAPANTRHPPARRLPQERSQRAIAEQYKQELLGQIQATQEAHRLQRQSALQEGARLRWAA